MEHINDDFHREQIQTLLMLIEKEAQLFVSTEEDKALPTNNSRKITENILPPFSATYSLVCNADLARTNIYSTHLIPAPASSYSTAYIALIWVQNISTWRCKDTTKTVVSLDLDLYEKCYLLVRTNSALKDKFIFCLGELHAVFAHVREIGTFINASRLGKALQVGRWFESSAVLPEIKECTHMK